MSGLASKNARFVSSKIQRVANLNVSKHFRKVMSLCAQAEVVENILLHGVQVGILHLHMLSWKDGGAEILKPKTHDSFFIQQK